jgi:serine/threonine-protein kinase
MTVRAKRAAQAQVTRTIGRYAMYGEIACGGMATVHFGRVAGAEGFSRPVAIKCLHPQFAKNAEFRAMFVDEARMVSRIRHQNVVPTLDIVASEDELFMVMEYVQGESLWRLMKAAHDRRVWVPPAIAITIISHVLHGLHAAHEACSETGRPLEIVHRDVSPQNVLVGTDGAARVLDFGVAHAALHTETTTGEKVKGKVSYMAPEQLAGAHATRKADVYAASVILWEMLAGRRLFYRSNPHALLVDKLFRTNVPAPSKINEHVPQAVDRIVVRGLARDPAERYATAREMAIALEGCGKLATLSEVGEWVERMAHDALEKRARTVADCESLSLPAAQAIHTPTTPSMSPLVASVAPTVASGDAPPRNDTPTHAVPALSRRIRRSLASLLEPDIDAKVLERVRRIAFERQRTIGASVALIGGFVALIGIARAIASHAAAADHDMQNAAPPEIERTHAVYVESSRTCPDGMSAVPGGAFVMGSDDTLPTSRPAHRVSLLPYCIDTFEVTTEDYKACSDRGDCKRPSATNEWSGVGAADKRVYDPLCNGRDNANRGRHPINCVDWGMAQDYCAARGARLPTEAEWELAARGTEGRKYPWGDEAPTARLVNGCGKECVEWGKRNRTDESPLFGETDGWATTAPVGSFPDGQSPYGVQDLVGNVWEWVADYWGPYDGAPADDPHGPTTGHDRVIRGGAWNGSYAAWMRPAFRYHDPPETKSYGIGFRCASDQGRYASDVRDR